MVKNQIIYEIFGHFLTYLQNCFLFSNLISECLHTQIISTKSFYYRIKNDSDCMQYCNFHQCLPIFAVARWNHPYMWVFWCCLLLFLTMRKFKDIKLVCSAFNKTCRTAESVVVVGSSRPSSIIAIFCRWGTVWNISIGPY